MRSIRTGIALATLAAVCLLSRTALAGQAAPALTPGSTFFVQFPEMPPTYWALQSHKTDPAQMGIALPRNYTPSGKFPLLIFLNGGSGGNGVGLGVIRTISAGKDFVCVNMPLFIKDLKAGGGIIQDEDGAYMWPYFRTMLEKLLQVVPNIDTDHMILGGFSNGSHAVQGLIDGSGGEIARRFAAFFLIEGGPRVQRWNLLKGKPYLIVISQGKSLEGMKLYCAAAKEAGVNASLICQDIGAHGIPEQAYPAMSAWLTGPAMTKASPAPAPASTKSPAAQQGAAKQSEGDVAGTDTLKTFDELLKSANPPEQPSGQGPMTFFAPTDAAFAAMPKARLDALKKDPKAARELLLNLMVKQDISPGNLPFAGKLQTLGGGMLTASQAKAPESDTAPLGLASVNGATVIKRVPVSRGRRIYLLDKVIFAE